MVHTLKTWWSRLANVPLGRWIFSKILSFLIPYTGTTAPYVRNLRSGYAEVSIKDRYRNRNHLSSIHALALANVGELTTGLALHFAMTANQRAILTRLESEYMKKARGTVIARAQLNPSGVVLGANIVEAVIVDESNTPVAKVKALWLVDDKSQAKGAKT